MTRLRKQSRKIHSTSALAEYLGISRWTVSRVLNGHSGVSETTRKRVLKAMQELGFTPNPMARGLRGSRTNLIGVCFQELESPILVRKTIILQNKLRTHNYRAILELTANNPQLEADVIRHFISMGVDGIVLVGSLLNASDESFNSLREAQIPCVFIDPVNALPEDFAFLKLDRGLAMRQLFTHLLELGHRSFAFLGLDEGIIYGDEKVSTLRECVETAGLSWKDDVIRLCYHGKEIHDYQYGYDMTRDLLAKSSLPTSILSLNDRIAIGVLKCLREHGIVVPRDISLVSYDNLDIAAYCNPPLTTIDQRVELIMAEATNILLKAMHDHMTPLVHQVISPEMVVRESACPPANRDVVLN